MLDASRLRAAFRSRLVDETLLRRLYFIFYFLWLLARQLGEPHCHLVLDIDRLTLNYSYRRGIESQLSDLVRIPVSFADCQVERYDNNLSWSASQFDALEREIEALTSAALK